MRRWSWARLGLSGEWALIPVAAAIGTLAGLAAVGFDWLVEHSVEFCFGLLSAGRERWWYLGLVLMMPAAGGLLVGLIQRYLQNQRGPTHGVPDVIATLARRGGRLRTRDGLFKAITASLTIGTGGSAGVEGPIITIGSTVGGRVSDALRLGRHYAGTLVGCGAAGATAGIFNAPIAAVIFVLEVMLRDFSVRTFIPIVIAAVFGAAVTQGVLGEDQAVFALPPEMHAYTFAFTELPAYLLLGALAGLTGGLFTRMLPASERWWSRRQAIPIWMRPGLGGLAVGLLGVVFVALAIGPVTERSAGYAAPPFFGNGYLVISGLLDPASYAGAHAPALWLLVGLVVIKLVATTLTIGSGGSGGIIAPSLFSGAALGAAVGVAVAPLDVLGVDSPATVALAGMAAVVAATLHCPLAAVLLVFELTSDYQVILPMMLVTVLGTAVAQKIAGDSLYGAFLRQKGLTLGSYGDLTLLRRLTVADVPLVPAVVAHPTEPAQRLVELARDYAAADFVVTDDDERYAGLVVGADLRAALLHPDAVALMIVEELQRVDLPMVSPDETLETVLTKFAMHEVASLAVVDEGLKVVGVITRARLMRHYQSALSARG